MKTQGRAVKGELIRGEDGYWREVVPVRKKGKDLNPLSKEERKFIVSCYVPGTLPRTFVVDGREMGSAEFVIECAARFGWSIAIRRPATWYRYVGDVLLDAGFRVQVETIRQPAGGGTGEAKLPMTLRDAEKYWPVLS